MAGKQSQANKNFWYAYAVWGQKVAQALARRRAEAEARLRNYVKANFNKLALMIGSGVLFSLLALTPSTQNTSLTLVDEHPKWDEYVQTYTYLLSASPVKTCLDVVTGQSGVGGLSLGDCGSGGGGGFIEILIMAFLAWWQTATNVQAEPQNRNDDQEFILVSHYTSAGNAFEILTTKVINPSPTGREWHVYVFEGRSNRSRASLAGAIYTEVRIVFDARQTELEIDPDVSDRIRLRSENPMLYHDLIIIEEARRFRLPGSIDISWRNACIEKPILGIWLPCR